MQLGKNIASFTAERKGPGGLPVALREKATRGRPARSAEATPKETEDSRQISHPGSDC